MIKTLYFLVLPLFFLNCVSKKTTEHNLSNEILIQWHTLESKETVEKEYRVYDLTFKSQISRSQLIDLYTFNPEKIKMEAFIEMLQLNPEVKTAQPNHKVDLREFP